MHGRIPLNEKQKCQLREASSDSIVTAKLYTIEDIFMMDTSIVDLHKRVYIPALYKLIFHFPHVKNLGTTHCIHTRQEAFKRRKYFQHILCRRYYADCVISSFAHQIQSEKYAGNQCIFIEFILLERFSATDEET